MPVSREHQVSEAFAALRIGSSFEEAAALSGLPFHEIVELWNVRRPDKNNEFNPLAHEQTK